MCCLGFAKRSRLIVGYARIRMPATGVAIFSYKVSTSLSYPFSNRLQEFLFLYEIAPNSLCRAMVSLVSWAIKNKPHGCCKGKNCSSHAVVWCEKRVCMWDREVMNRSLGRRDRHRWVLQFPHLLAL